ncbi:MAG: sodium:proton exchanger [Thermoplasmata archaeon]|nr:sodium:proton exchanger [Thermoplasmata archaeon]
MPEATPVEPRVARRRRWALAAALGGTLPGVVLRAVGSLPGPVPSAAVFGLAIVAAAFLLAWAAEALQLDVSRGLALAVLALIAVLPEYAVDVTFAAKAGGDPHRYAPLALANMTGGNRLLIGVGWPLVVLVAAWRMRTTARRRGYDGPLDTVVRLDRTHSVEIVFLALATLYSLSLPLRSHVTLFDATVLIALYGAYAWRISRAPAEEPELVGPAALLGTLVPRTRRVTVAALLVYAAVAIGLSAEPFAEALVETGSQLGVSTFLLVQWLAPLASEAPELIVAGLFAWRLNTNAGLGTLVSSKVNQWTLLVGSLPIVFVVAGGAAHGLPIDALQREELLLTAAQSAFAVAVLADRRISTGEAFALLGLFGAQFVLGGILPGAARESERVLVSGIYLLLTVGVLWRRRRVLRPLIRDGLRTPVDEMVGESGS